MQVQVLFPALARFHNGVSLFLIMKIQRRTRGAVALEAMREKNGLFTKSRGKQGAAERRERRGSKSTLLNTHFFFIACSLVVKPCQTVEKPSANAKGSNPLENGRQDDFLRRKIPFPEQKLERGVRRGAASPFISSLRPFLTSSHGGAMSSAAAMDLYSPGIP